MVALEDRIVLMLWFMLSTGLVAGTPNLAAFVHQAIGGRGKSALPASTDGM